MSLIVLKKLNFDKILEYGNIILKVSNGGFDKVFIYNTTSKEELENIKIKFKKSFESNFGMERAEFFHLYSKKRIVLEKTFLPLTDLYEFKFFILNHNIIFLYLVAKDNNKKDKPFFLDSNFVLLKENKNYIDINIFDKDYNPIIENSAYKILSKRGNMQFNNSIWRNKNINEYINPYNSKEVSNLFKYIKEFIFYITSKIIFINIISINNIRSNKVSSLVIT